MALSIKSNCKEFTSAAELVEHYHQLKARMNSLRPPAAKPKPPPTPVPRPRVVLPPIRFGSPIIRRSQRTPFDRIVHAVAWRFGVSKEKLLGKIRKDHVVVPRFVVMLLTHELLKWESSQIARHLDKDHSTVLNGLESLERRMERNKKLAETVNDLHRQLLGGIMRYGRIDAVAHKMQIIETDTFDEAQRLCGLKPHEIDHGLIVNVPGVGGLGLFVDEYGLFVPPLNQNYFALGERLYAGNALVYAFDAKGVTVDFEDSEQLSIRWFGSGHDVQRAIQRGEIIAPQIRVNGELIWMWPAPRPASMRAE
jgi:hypothetical protein